MAKNALSMKELTEETKDVERERVPRYWVKQPLFHCPMSPYIMWHYNLIYASCPLARNHRDMGICEKCCLKGDSKKQDKKQTKDTHYNKKETPDVAKREKESIPKIGKTYNSDSDK